MCLRPGTRRIFWHFRQISDISNESERERIVVDIENLRDTLEFVELLKTP